MAKKIKVTFDAKKAVDDIADAVKVELLDEFTQNFQRGAFFDKKWKKKANGEDSHLIKTGKLRRSIRARCVGLKIIFTSSEDYAIAHNDGITLPIHIREFKRRQRTKKGIKLVEVRAHWRNMDMPKRQFIGINNHVKKIILDVVKEELRAILNI